MKNTLKAMFCFILALAISACAVSCGKSGETTASATNTNTGNTPENGALGLLETIWNAYSESEKFPVSGGDESNLNFEGPGKYSTESAEMLDNMLGLPTDLADKIDDAASLTHAMNANTFTCGAFHFKTSTDAENAISKIKSNILSRHWICGFPDSLLIISAPGNYVIAVWGIDKGTGIISAFKNKVQGTIDGAVIAVSEPIV